MTARRALAAVALAVALACAGCGTVGLRAASVHVPTTVPACTSTPSRTLPDAVAGIRALDVTLVDESRPTPANRLAPASPCRVLPTLVLLPPAADAGRRPLIVFAHGFGSTALAYERYLAEFASAGYVVAAPTFPLSRGAAPGGAVKTDSVHQPADLSFVISTLLDGGLGIPLIDPHRIALVGHSLGGTTVRMEALVPGFTDPRVKAVVAYSGTDGDALPGRPATTSGAHQPMLIEHSDADAVVPYACSRRTYDTVSPSITLLTLHGAPHTPFAVGTRWRSTMVASTLDFLALHLDGDASAANRLAHDASRHGVASYLPPRPTGAHPLARAPKCSFLG